MASEPSYECSRILDRLEFTAVGAEKKCRLSYVASLFMWDLKTYCPSVKSIIQLYLQISGFHGNVKYKFYRSRHARAVMKITPSPSFRLYKDVSQAQLAV